MEENSYTNKSLHGKDCILLIKNMEIMDKLTSSNRYKSVQYISKGQTGIKVFAILGDITLNQLHNDPDIIRYNISYNIK